MSRSATNAILLTAVMACPQIHVADVVPAQDTVQPPFVLLSAATD